MSSMGSGYDLSVATFSPDGRVFQVEYAMKAVENSGLTLGAVFADGILLAVDKHVPSKLTLDSSGTRVFKLARHAVCVVAGALPDARELVSRARLECSNYAATWGHPISGCVLADRIGLFVHGHTSVWSTRPFGCSILVGVAEAAGDKPFALSGYAQKMEIGPAAEAPDMADAERPDASRYSLWLIDPTGAAYRYRGTALARGAAGAKSDLERLKLDELTVEEGVTEFAKTLTQQHQEFREHTMKMEMIWVRASDEDIASLVPPTVMGNAERAAADYLERMDA